MRKYLLICVTYHSDKELQAFLESVRCAAEHVKGQMVIDIHVVDSGKDNKGYLGGALPVYNERAKEYDFVSISNVDLQLAPDFFEQLLHIDTKGAGWIAPDIYTDKLDSHVNPFMHSRPTKRNFMIWNIIHSSTWIYRMYYALYVLKNKYAKAYPACDIYAGYGSFMLFTKDFVLHNPDLHFPGFMYGEEIFMAELVRKVQLRVLYCPTLHISEIGSVSTDLVNPKRKARWNKESLRAIYNLFFE